MPQNVSVNILARDVNFTAMMQKMRAEMNQSVASTVALSTAMGGLKMSALLGAAGLALMVAPTLLASKAVAEYDASLRRAIAIGGESYTGQMENLSEAIMDTAIKWGLSSDEIAAGVVELAKAGYDYNKVTQEMMTGVAQLAKVHQESFDTIANIVTYAYTLYGDETTSAMDLMDKMNEAANISVLNIEELGSAFEYAGSSALTSGMSVDEFLATIAALSQVAQKSYQNIGTLLNRILVTGKELENELGVANGTFVKDGIMNISAFIKYLGEVPDKYDVIVKASELWGVRSTRVIQALMAVPEEYFEFLETIGSAQGNLESQSEDMAESLESTWTSLIQTFQKPIKAGSTLEAIQRALKSLTTALSESNVSSVIGVLVTQSALFLEEYGPSLIETLTDLISTLMELYPTFERIGKIAAGVLEIISAIPAPVIAIIGTMMMLKRFIPITEILAFSKAVSLTRLQIIAMDKALVAEFETMGITVPAISSATASTKALGLAINATAIKAQILSSVGMFAIFSGMMAIITTEDDFVRALGGIAVAMGAVAMAALVWAGAESAITWGAAALAGAAGMAAMYQQMKKQEDLIGHEKGGLIAENEISLIHRGEFVVPAETVRKQRISRVEDVVSRAYVKENISEFINTKEINTARETEITALSPVVNRKTGKKSSKYPAYERGGQIETTGPALLHRGEYIVPSTGKIIPRIEKPEVIRETGLAVVEKGGFVVPSSITTLSTISDKKLSSEREKELIRELDSSKISVERKREIISMFSQTNGKNVSNLSNMVSDKEKISDITKETNISNIISNKTKDVLRENSLILTSRDSDTSSNKSVLETKLETLKSIEIKNVSSQIEAYEKGGIIKNSGLVLLHKGEYVVPKEQVDKVSFGLNISKEPIKTDTIESMISREVLDKSYKSISDSRTVEIEKRKRENPFLFRPLSFKESKIALKEMETNYVKDYRNVEKISSGRYVILTDNNLTRNYNFKTYEHGGPVTQTGVAEIHEGEMIVSAKSIGDYENKTVDAGESEPAQLWGKPRGSLGQLIQDIVLKPWPTVLYEQWDTTPEEFAEISPIQAGYKKNPIVVPDTTIRQVKSVLNSSGERIREIGFNQIKEVLLEKYLPKDLYDNVVEFFNVSFPDVAPHLTIAFKSQDVPGFEKDFFIAKIPMLYVPGHISPEGRNITDEYTTYPELKMAEPIQFQKGGLVKDTGLALIHKGEFVISKSQTDKLKNVLSNEVSSKNIFNVITKHQNMYNDSFKTVTEKETINSRTNSLYNNSIDRYKTVFNIPSYQYGGRIRETGLAIVHKDEYVMPKAVVGRELVERKSSSPEEKKQINYDYRTINIFDPTKLDLQRAMKGVGR